MGGNNKKNKNRQKKKNRQNSKHNNQISGDNAEHLDDESKVSEPHDEAELNQSDTGIKRQYDGEDSENEDQPKRKKKKKQPMIQDTGDKKGKKSIRQMKREKFAERQAEAQAVAKDHLKSQCLHYLSEWKYNKQNWKFMKAKQVWLYKNKFSTSLLPDSSWPLLLEYFESAQGNIRKMLLDDANKVIKQMDEWTESQTEKQTEQNDNEDDNNDDSEAIKSKKPDETVYKRARDLIQCLEE